MAVGMDEQAFAASARRMEARLYRVAAALVWDDMRAAEEIRTCILQTWQRQGRWRDAASLERWMLRRLIVLCRRYRPVQGSMKEAADPVLQAALRRLPVRYRLALILWEELPAAQAARVMHLPAWLAEKRIRKAERLLETALKEVVD